jgi:predicted TIM-barrel fold metal-dependent hydrolase
MVMPRGPLFTAALLLAPLCASCAVSRPDPIVLAAIMPERIGPNVDHHQHLLSPAGAALLDRFEGGGPHTSVAVPSEVAELLNRRAKSWNDAAGLAELYTDDAMLLDNGPIAGKKQVVEHVGKRFGRAYALAPVAFSQGQRTRQVTALYTRGEGAERTNFGYAMITLAQHTSGDWRIASEVMKFPGPPEYRVAGSDALIGLLDEAKITRAVIMSSAYLFESPFLGNAYPNGAAMLRAESDWTAREIARHPTRLTGFCGVNPLTEQALAEVRRCKDELGMVGIKLHFANSRVELENPDHLGRMKAFFAGANRLRMPIAAHLWTTGKYGPRDSELFLAELLPQAPDIVVQIMHMAGAGPGWTDAALEPLATAAAAKDLRMKNVYFDVATAADDQTPSQLDLLATRIRQIGPSRILYGSDGFSGGRGTPKREWGNFRGMVPLTDAEFAIIRDNVAPYLG